MSPRSQARRAAYCLSLLIVTVSLGQSLFAQEQSRERIVFSSLSDLYSMNTDGTHLLRLTSEPGTDTHPSCASNGKIAFSSSRIDNKFDIYVMNPDGTNQTRLTTNPYDEMFPTWSPDGKKIAFSRRAPGPTDYSHIWIMNADGSGEQQLTLAGTRDNSEPAWSPDGRKIAFTSTRSNGTQIWVMDADGSNPVNISNYQGEMNADPSWSPDGSKIAFVRSNWPASKIMVMSADGTGQRILVNDSTSNEAAWSPDGRQIAFSSMIGGGFHKIYLVNADGGNLIRLTNDSTGGDRSPCFQRLPVPGSISFAEPFHTVNEGDGTVAISLTRTGGTDGAVVAKVSIADVTTSPADYAAAGRLDPTYNVGTGVDALIYDAVVQPDDKVIVVGSFTRANGFARNSIARLNADGSVDTSFVGDLLGPAQTLALQPDGKVLVAGVVSFTGGVARWGIVRLNSNGTLDQTFNAHSGTNVDVRSVISQPDGKILIGGRFTEVNGVARNYLARLNPDGSLDTAFIPSSRVFTSVVYTLALQPDGKILAGGAGLVSPTFHYTGLVRLNADGSLDKTFTVTGANVVLDLHLLGDGKVLVVGAFDSVGGVARSRVARLNADGSLDPSFDPGAGSGVGPNGNNNSISSVDVQPDGKIIVAGPFTFFDEVARMSVARLNADGSLDTEFDTGAGPTMLGSSPGVNVARLQSDGSVIIAGGFTSVDGTPRNRIAALRGDLIAAWADGDETAKVVLLPIVDDLLVEPDETLTLTLTLTPLSGTSALGANTSASVTIVDNDVPPTITSDLPPSFMTQGREYRHTFTATGSPKPTFNVTAGTLPMGLSLMPSTGQLSGTPHMGGVYNITVTASNGVSPAASQTFTLRVNRVPAALQNNYSLSEDSNLTIAAPGVLANDVDMDGDPLTAELISTTTKGALTFNSDGSFIYTPNPDFNGADGFIYRVTDGNEYSQNATVFLNVTGANDAPVNSVPGAQVVAENNPLIFSTARGNLVSVSDIDANASPIRVALTATGGTLTLSRIAGLTFFSGDGTADAAMTFNGTLQNINLALNGMSFIPATGFSGAASLQISTSDLGNTGTGGVLTDVDVVNISVLKRGDFHFAAPTYRAAEKAGTITITVARTGGSAGAAAVNYSTSDGSANAGADYASASGVLHFADGETSKTFSITIIDDAAAEADETVNLTLGIAGGSAASAVLTILDDDSSTLLFSAQSYQASEGDGRVTVIVNRSGDASGAASVDYRTVDTDKFTVGCFDSAGSQGGAFARCDFATTVGTLSFAAGETSKNITVPLIDDGHAEGSETLQVRLSNATGATLGTPDAVTVTITDNDAAGAANPVVSSFSFFVRQQYLDFLSREPDMGGFNAWHGVLNGCANAFNGPLTSSGCDRIFVSGEGFFRSVEFQLKGFYVFRFYKVGADRLPEYSEVVSDMSLVAGQTPEEVFARKAQLATLFTERQEFKSAYSGLSNFQYVNTLLGRYGLTQITTFDPHQPDGTAKVTLTSADLTNGLEGDTLTRAQVLRAIADSDAVSAAEFNNAFVGMQYYGYLRRKPDTAGFNAWLGVLQSGDVRTMVNGFLNSAEYKLRFGQP